MQAISQKHLFPVAVWLTLSFTAVANGAEDVRQEIPDLQEKVSAARSNAKHALNNPFLNLLNSLNLLKSGGSLKSDVSEPTDAVGVFDESHWDEATYE